MADGIFPLARSPMCWVAAAVVFTGKSVDTVVAQEPDPQVAEYMATLTPTAAHESLAGMAGEWDTVQRIWIDPTEAARESRGTATGTMRFGNRFLFLEIEGVSLGGSATVLVIFGYDVFKGEYQATAVGDNSTAMYTSTGKDSIDVFDMRGRMDDPFGSRPVRYLYRIESDQRFVAEIFDTADDGEVKVAEIEFTRRR